MVITLLLVQFFLYKKGFYSVSADEGAHTLEGYWWYMGYNNIFSMWLPFQKILFGYTFHVYYDLFWVPKILSSLFGIFTLLSLMFLAYELFQDKIVSLLSGFLGSLFWGIAIFSAIALTEIYFFFFVITSIALILHWRNVNKEIFLWLSILLSAIGTTIRYEAWIFSLVLFIVITINICKDRSELQKKVFRIVGISILLFSFPLLWIYFSFSITNHTTGFINTIVQRYHPGGILSDMGNNVLYNFLKMNIRSLNILGFISLYTIIFFATLFLMSIVTFVSKAMPNHDFWRLAAIWSIMLLPFTAKWLNNLFMEKKLQMKISASLILIIIVFFSTNQVVALSSRTFMSKEDISTGKYIKSIMKLEGSDSKIFIEKNNYEFVNLLVASQVPDRFIVDEKYFKNTKLHSNPADLKDDLIKGFKKFNIRYLILTPNSYLSPSLLDLKEIKNFIIWKIYKLK